MRHFLMGLAAATMLLLCSQSAEADPYGRYYYGRGGSYYNNYYRSYQPQIYFYGGTASHPRSSQGNYRYFGVAPRGYQPYG